MRNRVGVEALPGSALISLLSTKMYSFSVALLLALNAGTLGYVYFADPTLLSL